MALSFDMLTALAVSGMTAILAIYVIVVYKKGWLRKESKTDQAYYLCPSQKCRRVFKKPVWLTDLSQAPPESYQACPHCGINIQVSSPSSLAATMPGAGTKSSTGVGEVAPAQNRLRFTCRDSTKEKSESGCEQKPSAQAGVANRQVKSDSEQAAKPLFQFPQARMEAQLKSPEPPKRSGENGSIESLRKCSHFFGYVKTLPKNTPIPDECLWCPSIVECLSYKQKVKAEA